MELPKFANDRERTFWVQGHLRLQGLSFADIARAGGWTRVAVANAMYRPSNAIEIRIAETLGLAQEALFPERFDSDGRRLHHVRHNSPDNGPGNVKRREVA